MKGLEYGEPVPCTCTESKLCVHCRGARERIHRLYQKESDMSEQKRMTAVQAIRTFFGLKPGESLQDFMAELKALTPAEKNELAEQIGVELDAIIEKAA